ncbi:MAG: hypothetical protein AAFW70_23850 [Cyanobacteria bacterium J06635_10]
MRRNILVNALIMKYNLTVASVLFNSFLVVLFAACGVNSHEKAENCSNLDSEIFLPQDNSLKSQTEDSSHPMLVAPTPNYEKESHPMYISPCPKLENELKYNSYKFSD